MKVGSRWEKGWEISQGKFPLYKNSFLLFYYKEDYLLFYDELLLLGKTYSASNLVIP